MKGAKVEAKETKKPPSGSIHTRDQWKKIMHQIRTYTLKRSSRALELMRAELEEIFEDINANKKLVKTFKYKSKVRCSASNDNHCVFGSQDGKV